jgi:hypothetical protein
VVKVLSLRCFCGKHRAIGRLATLSEVTVVTLYLPLYSSHEWRTPGAPAAIRTPSLSTFAAVMSRCEEEAK